MVILYKINYLLDKEEEYYIFLNDAIQAGMDYIDLIAERDGDWDDMMLTYAKNYLKAHHKFEDIVEITTTTLR